MRSFLLTLGFVCVLAVAAGGPARATSVTLYVDASGTATTGCTSPGTAACTTIQDGVNAAELYTSTDVTIEVAAGDYYEAVLVDTGSDTLTIQGAGADSTTVHGGAYGYGSDFLIQGTATVEGFTITTGIPEPGGNGGGVYGDDSSNVTLTNDVITANVADNGGGVYSNGTLTLSNDTISSNTGDQSGGSGAGVYVGGQASLSDDTITGNYTFTGGGGGGLPELGGGIYVASTGTATVSNDSITNNLAELNGGGGGIFNAGTATVSDDTIAGNTGGTSGGGGIASYGTATISSSTISDNTDQGGGGGGVYLANQEIVTNSGHDTLAGDTIAGNTTDGYGGGLYNSGYAVLTNDTLAGNDGGYYPGYDPGHTGGIFNIGGSTTASLTDVTLANNQGYGIYEDIATATFSDSILYDDGCGGNNNTVDGGHNVESDDSCNFGASNVVNSSTIDLAASLANNGGPTQTLALSVPSSAIDEVPAAACTITTDERGATRPGAGGTTSCDAGAYEATLAVAPPQNKTQPVISGTAQDGQYIKLSMGKWTSPETLAYSYQWQRCDSGGGNCADIGGATLGFYKLIAADVGHKIQVVVTATDEHSQTGQATSNQLGAVSDPPGPQNTVPPVISGTAQDGQYFTVTSSGKWTSPDTLQFSYQWQRCNSDGTTCSNVGSGLAFYKQVAADVGHWIRVIVTAEDQETQSSQEFSNLLGAVADPPGPQSTVAPTISGTAEDGQFLTVASNGKWTTRDMLTFTYQWRRCNSLGLSCVDIGGATLAFYKLTSADVDHKVEVVVTDTDQESQSAAAVSNQLGAVTGPSAPQNTVAPVISGTAQVGQFLVTTNGKWTSADPLVFTYQWLRCDSSGNNCVDITGATHPSYKLVAADSGHKLQIVVTDTDQENQTGQATSNQLGPIT